MNGLQGETEAHVAATGDPGGTSNSHTPAPARGDSCEENPPNTEFAYFYFGDLLPGVTDI